MRTRARVDEGVCVRAVIAAAAVCVCLSEAGVALEARGGRHANAKLRKGRFYFDLWPRPGEGGIYT